MQQNKMGEFLKYCVQSLCGFLLLMQQYRAMKLQKKKNSFFSTFSTLSRADVGRYEFIVFFKYPLGALERPLTKFAHAHVSQF